MKAEYPKLKSVPNRPKKRWSIGGMLRILGRIIIIILLFEVTRNVFSGLLTHPVTAQYGTIEKGFWADALFLRYETVLTASHSGKLVYSAKAGSLVPTGEIIATIDDGTNATGPTDSVPASKQLDQLRRELVSLGQDLNRVNAEMKNKQSLLVTQSNRGMNTAQIKQDLNNLEQEKGIILRNINKNNAELRELNATTVNANHDNLVLATTPGYLFYQYDEWETKLLPADFPQITVADLQRRYSLREVGNSVRTGGMVAKIIDPFNQQIVIRINAKATGIPEVGARWWLKNGEALRRTTVLKVTRIAGDNEYLVALDDPGIGQSILPERRYRVFVVYRRCSGVLIPTQAVFHHQKDPVVRVMKGDGYKEQSIRVIETDGSRAIVEGIDFGETIISR